MLRKIHIKTNDKVELIDITGKVKTVLSESGVKEGTMFIYTPHTTAGITINENADPDVVSDIINEINKIVPFNDDYSHREGNSAAHIKSSLFGVSETVIINERNLVLGTWQGIYFCEFDGSRQRTIYVKIIED
ncbi:MAG: secondary thiamine-phosphate synthase enzyme YjbQ [Halanaerobiaceae bacterium]